MCEEAERMAKITQHNGIANRFKVTFRVSDEPQILK